MALIGTGLEEIRERQDTVLEDLAADAGRLAVTIARKVSAEQARVDPMAALEALVVSNLRELIDEPRVVIRVTDTLLGRVAERIDQLAAECGFAGRLVILSDDDIAESDCRMEWADGGARRDSAAMWQQIDDAAGRLFAETETTPETAPADQDPTGVDNVKR